ncbi:MAG: methyltransferase [Oscillospiraceae bacterium]|nr:methyltransferase [Oscillospiraceae bacterium]
MNRRIPFVPGELDIVDTLPGFMGGPGFPIRNTPVSPRENVAALFHEKHPYWTPTPSDFTMHVPRLYDDMLGRGGPEGTTDAFGVGWEWVESAGGSIVRPGDPFISDANEWRDKIKIPNIDEWDWESAAKQVKLDTRISNQFTLINGFWFERLVSFMDFAPAAVALIDDDQKDAVKDLFEALTELGIRVVDKMCEYWPAIDGFNVHDDWAAQKAPFFSEDVAYEMFVPHMKRLTDHIHSKGRFATLHSCGHGEDRVRCFIDGGFDGWDPQIMNDTHKLYEDVGGEIVISVVPEPFDASATSEDAQRARAREFFDNFCKPGKPAMINFYGLPALTPAFSGELYSYSRERYFHL